MNLGKVYYKQFKSSRLKRKFSLFPKILSNNTMIWLEFYYSYQIYRSSGIAWAGNNWRPNKSWTEEFSCSSRKELKIYLKRNYLEKKRCEESWKRFLQFNSQSE